MAVLVRPPCAAGHPIAGEQPGTCTRLLRTFLIER
ncbi:hypothetical protein HD596_012156 [Nonomuraea jabiensis]|uniref:Uncharacterized protein n=1 Tax=Nonomuraea jabiensis TaxID=882448 RepID=A0A7W9GKE0_9ACTN|nr:hypothetical protein [Nonomuraea jabiensis]